MSKDFMVCKLEGAAEWKNITSLNLRGGFSSKITEAKALSKLDATMIANALNDRETTGLAFFIVVCAEGIEELSC